MGNKVILGVVILGVAAVVGFVLVGGQKQSGQQIQDKSEKMEEQGLMQGKGTKSNEPQENLIYYQGTILAGKGSMLLLDFKKADYDRALASEKVIFLYFYANWCPICLVEVPNALIPAFNEFTTDKVIGFRVNYNDSDTDEDEKTLAKQFGITYQHTKVILKDGKEVLKSLDSWDKDKYLQAINAQVQ